MRLLNAEQRQRLDLLYGILDRAYEGMQCFTALQRMAVRQGKVPSVLAVDNCLKALSTSVGNTWLEITQILNEDEQVTAPESEPPATETIQ